MQIVTNLDYKKHIKPALKTIKTWNRVNIENITKYEPVMDDIIWFGAYDGNGVDDIGAILGIEYLKKDKTICIREFAAGKKGYGKILFDSVLDWCKKNKNGCNTIEWLADPAGGEGLKEYYRKNWPKAKETTRKNEYWEASQFTLRI